MSTIFGGGKKNVYMILQVFFPSQTSLGKRSEAFLIAYDKRWANERGKSQGGLQA